MCSLSHFRVSLDVLEQIQLSSRGKFSKINAGNSWGQTPHLNSCYLPKCYILNIKLSFMFPIIYIPCSLFLVKLGPFLCTLCRTVVAQLVVLSGNQFILRWKLNLVVWGSNAEYMNYNLCGSIILNNKPNIYIMQSSQIYCDIYQCFV